MGRAPCCDKSRVKRGPWSPEEDEQLRAYVRAHGVGGNWIALPHKAGLNRCGKSCRLRWLNYLRPDIRHGGYTEQEDLVICSLYASIGSRWSIIASKLPGRTDNDVKNYWNTKLKKKAMPMPMRGPHYHHHAGIDLGAGPFSAPNAAQPWSQCPSPSLHPAALSPAASGSSSADTSSSGGDMCFAAAGMYQPQHPIQGFVHVDSSPQTVLAPMPLDVPATGIWASSVPAASDVGGVALEDAFLADLGAYGDLLLGGFGGQLLHDNKGTTAMELPGACYFPNMAEMWAADHAHAHAHAKPPQGLCNTFT